MPEKGSSSIAAYQYQHTYRKRQQNQSVPWFCLCFLIMVAIFFAGCTGERGRMGATGLNGTPGLPGTSGAGNMTMNLTANMTAGPIGVNGTPGDPGPQGIQGIQGIQGVAGATGATGAMGGFGGFSGKWRFNTSTAVDAFTDPGTGNISFNSATSNLVGEMTISDTDADGNDLEAFLDSFTNSGDWGYIRIFSETDFETKFWDGQLHAVSDCGAFHYDIVTYIEHGGGDPPFADGEEVILTFAPTGATGATGASGIGDDSWYLWVNGTRPMAGNLSLDGFNISNVLDPIAAQDAATKAYVDAVNATGVTDHGLLTGLADDDHLQYANLSGRAGGQVWTCGVNDNDDCIISGTSSGTKDTSYVSLQPNGGLVSIGTANPSPAAKLYIVQNINHGNVPDLIIENRANTGYAGASILLNASQSDFRGSGIYTFNPISGETWYYGTRYGSSNDIFQIGKKSGSIVDYSSAAAGASVLSLSEGTTGRLTLNGTNTFVLDTTYTGYQEIPIGSNIYSTGNISILSHESIGDKTVIAYKGSSYLSALEIVNPPSGYGNLLLMKSGGNVTIGSSISTATFDVAGTDVRMRMYGAGTLMTDANGRLYVISDEKYKTAITPDTSGLKELENVNPICYKFTPESGLDTANVYCGVSAQNVQSAGISGAVYSKPDTTWTTVDNKSVEIPKLDKDGKQTTTHSINYGAITAALVNAVQEQQAIIDNQQGQINNLTKRMEVLEAKVGE